MLHWLRDRRRRALVEEPFPEAWDAVLDRNVAAAGWLSDGEREHLRQLVQIFVAEKSWEGCGGLELDDEIRVTIAAEACLLLLGLEHDFYRNVQSILVYPSTVVAPPQAQSVFAIPDAPVGAPVPILGQAQLRGPVILVWDAVKSSGRHPERGHNVVFHEFAHKLDMLDGAADGTPPMQDRAEFRRWVEVCSREYLALRAAAERGRKSFLDRYGATNEAEFFAVATEEFFTRPDVLKEHSPDLYGVLTEYYQQDPAGRR